MQSEAPQEVIQRVLNGDEPETDQLLSILYSCTLDLSQAVEFWVGHLNDSWAPMIKQRLDAGFQVFRIQTEFGFIGHETKIYMVKMK